MATLFGVGNLLGHAIAEKLNKKNHAIRKVQVDATIRNVGAQLITKVDKKEVNTLDLIYERWDFARTTCPQLPLIITVRGRDDQSWSYCCNNNNNNNCYYYCSYCYRYYYNFIGTTTLTANDTTTGNATAATIIIAIVTATSIMQYTMISERSSNKLVGCKS